jgi:hypothetical protein
LAAISRCFSGLIAAKPRLDPPLFLVAISFLRAVSVKNQNRERERANAVQTADSG